MSFAKLPTELKVVIIKEIFLVLENMCCDCNVSKETKRRVWVYQIMSDFDMMSRSWIKKRSHEMINLIRSIRHMRAYERDIIDKSGLFLVNYGTVLSPFEKLRINESLRDEVSDHWTFVLGD